ncbi:transporter [Dickeya oryzae]|uniref:Transporter n=1 Tax=Dickeya oryzae TaxID=1240404 RepID=A0AB39IMX2_9GAMM|nr:transporter [Dickeya oryzae]MBP2859087.1 transporter [Dickeya oryzae]MCA6993031.1 transporter [Dickeya oryzae]MCO7256366.1 transporter [Dickeya oryzae]
MRKLLLLLISTVSITSMNAAEAREPGIAPTFPPGLTLGLPIAVNPPPGFYFMNRLSYSEFQLKDGSNHNIGQKTSIWVDSLQLTWVPGITVLGGSYKTFVMLPFVDITMKRTQPTTGPLGSWRTRGLANPKFQPLDLTWSLGNNWHIGTGLGVYAPLGKYDDTAALNVAGNFWTIEPSLGVTYLKDKWHFSSQLVYNTNTRNDDNHYRSGDQVFLNSTLTYRFGNWDIGPVGYFMRQTTADSNHGGVTHFGGNVFPKQEQAGLGLLASTTLGKAKVYTYYTQDLYAHNTVAGGKLWLNVLLRL